METAIRHRLQKNAETKCSKEMLGLSTGEQLKDLINSYHKVLKLFSYPCIKQNI